MLKGVFNAGAQFSFLKKIIDEYFFQKLSKEKLKNSFVKRGDFKGGLAQILFGKKQK
jgi:hypothetical protein